MKYQASADLKTDLTPATSMPKFFAVWRRLQPSDTLQPNLLPSPKIASGSSALSRSTNL